MLANFETIFDYHGNQVTKTTDFEISSRRTRVEQQFDSSFVFLC